MTTSTLLTPKILGEAENAHRAVLARILGDSALDYRHWVTLTVVARGGSAYVDRLIERVSDGLKIDASGARQTIDELIAAGLLQPSDEASLRLTVVGQATYGKARSAIDAVIARVYADIPPGDLATVGRVLALVTARANTELEASQATGPYPELVD